LSGGWAGEAGAAGAGVSVELGGGSYVGLETGLDGFAAGREGGRRVMTTRWLDWLAGNFAAARTALLAVRRGCSEVTNPPET
jgi:hypothetical protein